MVCTDSPQFEEQFQRYIMKVRSLALIKGSVLPLKISVKNVPYPPLPGANDDDDVSLHSVDLEGDLEGKQKKVEEEKREEEEGKKRKKQKDGGEGGEEEEEEEEEKAQEGEKEKEKEEKSATKPVDVAVDVEMRPGLLHVCLLITPVDEGSASIHNCKIKISSYSSVAERDVGTTDKDADTTDKDTPVPLVYDPFSVLTVTPHRELPVYDGQYFLSVPQDRFVVENEDLALEALNWHKGSIDHALASLRSYYSSVDLSRWTGEEVELYNMCVDQYNVEFRKKWDAAKKFKLSKFLSIFRTVGLLDRRKSFKQLLDFRFRYYLISNTRTVDENRERYVLYTLYTLYTLIHAIHSYTKVTQCVPVFRVCTQGE